MGHMPIPTEIKTKIPGATQIKLFMNEKGTSDWKKIEHDVNVFLATFKDSIKVLDIKYTTSEPNPDNPLWKNWTVMVIYEVID